MKGIGKTILFVLGILLIFSFFAREREYTPGSVRRSVKRYAIEKESAEIRAEKEKSKKPKEKFYRKFYYLQKGEEKICFEVFQKRMFIHQRKGSLTFVKPEDMKDWGAIQLVALTEDEIVGNMWGHRAVVVTKNTLPERIRTFQESFEMLLKSKSSDPITLDPDYTSFEIWGSRDEFLRILEEKWKN